MIVPVAHRLHIRRRRKQRGSISVLAACVLYVIVLLGIVAWGGIQEGADHTLLTRIVANASFDASHHLVDQGLVTGVPALSCLNPVCAPVACPQALAQDQSGMTAAGQACLTLQEGLAHTYGGTNPRLDVTAMLAATHVWTLAPGAHDPEDSTRTYHYPTVCLSTDATIGVIAHDGLTFHHHFHSCAQAVYR